LISLSFPSCPPNETDYACVDPRPHLAHTPPLLFAFVLTTSFFSFPMAGLGSSDPPPPTLVVFASIRPVRMSLFPFFTPPLPCRRFSPGPPFHDHDLIPQSPFPWLTPDQFSTISEEIVFCRQKHQRNSLPIPTITIYYRCNLPN